VWKEIRKVFDAISVPILVIDRNYEIVEANQAALAHLDSPLDGVVGRTCFGATHDEERPCWQMAEVHCPVREAFETGRRAHAIHKHPVRGELIVEELVATPLIGSEDEIDYVIEEFRDVTELLDLREGILPICAACKEIRDLKGTWHPIEAYIHDHTGAEFSHALCPDCMRRLYPEAVGEIDEPKS